MKKLGYDVYALGAGMSKNKDDNNIYIDGDINNGKITKINSVYVNREKMLEDGSIEGIEFIPKNEVFIAKGDSPSSHDPMTIAENRKDILAVCINGVFYGLDKVVYQAGNIMIEVIGTYNFGIYAHIVNSSIELHENGNPTYVFDKDYVVTGFLVKK